MSENPKQTVLITGASSGIGEDLARIFAREGFDLVLVARRKEKLEALARELATEHGIRSRVLAKDLSLPTAAEEIYRELQASGIRVDVLVNNAGFGGFGPFVSSDLDHELRMIQVNMTALTYLMKLFSGDMIRRGNGRILNVASTAAFQPGPLMAVYYATKAYVLHLSEALREELKGSGITVTTLCPGPTRTDFQVASNIQWAGVFGMFAMDSRSVAQAAYRAVMCGQGICTPGLTNKIFALLVRFSPRSLVHLVVKFLMKKTKRQEG